MIPAALPFRRSASSCDHARLGYPRRVFVRGKSRVAHLRAILSAHVERQLRNVYKEHPFLPLGALKASGEPGLRNEYKHDKVARSSVSVDGAQGDECH